MRSIASFAAIILVGLGSQAAAQNPRTLAIAEHASHGAYLTDQSGMALYMFEEDRPQGFRGRPVESDCVGEDCLSRWPPLGGDPVPVAGDGIDASLIGSFVRPDGKAQATYNGWPIYYFAEDFIPGDINGHDFEEFGGEWYLLSPAGQVIGDDDENDDRRDDDDDDSN